MSMQASFIAIVDHLPEGLEALAAEAALEGFRHIRRLDDEWRNGIQRFARPGETLMAAFSGGELAAIGGVTVDPREPEAFRMRRFYVRPHYRRFGIGRALAQTLIALVKPDRLITVHAGTRNAPAFWESIGFVPVQRNGYSHILQRTC